jgi:hypothetical protein
MDRKSLRTLIQSLVAQGQLRRAGLDEFRVLKLTAAGRNRVACAQIQIQPDVSSSEDAAQGAPRPRSMWNDAREPLGSPAEKPPNALWPANHGSLKAEASGHPPPEPPDSALTVLTALSRSAPPARQDSYLATYTLAAAGFTIEDICTRRGLRPATIVQHLEILFKRGHPLDIDQYVDREVRRMIEKCLDSHAPKTLREAKRLLPEQVTFDDIALVRAAQEGRPVRSRR